MRDRLLGWLARLVVRNPRTTLLLAALVTASGAVLVPGLGVKAGHSSLFDERDVHQRRFRRFLEQFGSPNVLFVIVEGGRPAQRHRVIDRLLDRLPARAAGQPAPCPATGAGNAAGCVRDVIGRLDIAHLKRRGLLFLPLGQVRQLVQTLSDGLLGQLGEVEDLAGLVQVLADELERRAEQPAPDSASRARAAQAMEFFTKVTDELTRRVRAPQRLQRPLTEALSSLVNSARELRGGIDAEGYFTSHDGQLSLALVRPLSDSDDPELVTAFVRYVERHAREAIAAQGLAGRLELTLTGLPALVAEERAALGRDLPLTSSVAAVGIFLLFVFAFRSLRQGLLGMVPLLGALLCTLAFVRLTVGGLNMITSAFIPTMLGLGIDFAVHLLARYNEGRWQGLSSIEAASSALRVAGPGIITSAAATAAAFAALAVNRFRGFAELGVITAVGLLFSLVAICVVITAVLALPQLGFLHRPPRRRAVRGAGVGGWLVRHRVFVVTGGVTLTALALWRAPQIPWSYNYLDLLPAAGDALRGMRILSQQTDFSAEVAAMRAGSLDEAARLAARLRRQPTVGRVESLADYLPRQQQQKLQALARLRPQLAVSRATPTTVDLEAIDRALEALSDALEDARFAAKRASDPAAALLVGPGRAVVRLRRAIATSATADRARAHERLAQLQRQVFAALDEGLALLRANVEAEPLTERALLAALPPGIAARLHQRGQYAIYVHPRRSVWQGDVLPRFVAEVRTVRPDATGFAVTHWEANLLIRSGFRDASILSLVVLLVLLLADFRRPGYTILALLPLAMGVVWMLGGMALLGLAYNFANVIAFPLIVGIGIASGVHILHRYRQEGDIVPVVRHTGLACFLSAATTMIGFGSLSLSQHRGAASLGMLLLLGVGACLVTATLFLPALLRHRGPRERLDDPA